MAIDTQTKRRSVHGYTGASAVIAPLVDGAALDEANRRAVAGVYRGITSGAGGTLTGTARACRPSNSAVCRFPVQAGQSALRTSLTLNQAAARAPFRSSAWRHQGENRLLAVVGQHIGSRRG